MLIYSKTVLVRLLQNVASVAKVLTVKEWELLIRQARAAGILGQLYYLLQRLDCLGHVPEKAIVHMQSAVTVSLKQAQAAGFEIEQLKNSLDSVERLVLLKGAAYIARELTAAKGRFMADIDIIVPRVSLPKVEQALALSGWFSVEHDEYDEHYYRTWMHEIPPLTQIKRQTSLDVHHSILPLTAKYHPNPVLLLDAAVELKDRPGVFVLDSVDMIIHSAAHLFHEGEFDHGLRDLLDLRSLMEEFAEMEPGFWERLAPRAAELELVAPLHYAVRYLNLVLGYKVPDEVAERIAEGGPSRVISPLMDFLFLRAFSPDHASANTAFTGISRWLLYVRSHYIRMPAYLLIPHLIRKAWKRRIDDIKQPKVEAHKADDLPVDPR